jgi:hypothetical protein
LLHHISELRGPFVQCFALITCVVSPCTKVFSQSVSPHHREKPGLIPKETWANHVVGRAQVSRQLFGDPSPPRYWRSYFRPALIAGWGQVKQAMRLS